MKHLAAKDPDVFFFSGAGGGRIREAERMLDLNRLGPYFTKQAQQTLSLILISDLIEPELEN